MKWGALHDPSDRDRPGHGFPPLAGRQKFFANISRSFETLSMDSANSFLSRAFYSSRRSGCGHQKPPCPRTSIAKRRTLPRWPRASGTAPAPSRPLGAASAPQWTALAWTSLASSSVSMRQTRDLSGCVHGGRITRPLPEHRMPHRRSFFPLDNAFLCSLCVPPMDGIPLPADAAHPQAMMAWPMVVATSFSAVHAHSSRIADAAV